ncbi:hypothetical protein ATE84_0972 [Aquimarina sp. MAR_2010_214]|uniref:hypothetical protein n=1 Tax=Aquimarina sp. MAR_2010_214 TaxID=1250026 RepID=UPI000C711091|nr:hypothetical protein [Aquimarina sp. MAR_2010_214]PKV48956.1 hypothetical protein ATE84_0972 [Aquimarina sp. MAR_2010_214]
MKKASLLKPIATLLLLCSLNFVVAQTKQVGGTKRITSVLLGTSVPLEFNNKSMSVYEKNIEDFTRAQDSITVLNIVLTDKDLIKRVKNESKLLNKITDKHLRSSKYGLKLKNIIEILSKISQEHRRLLKENE